MAFEMALKKDKPMIMSDEDMKHFNSMFTGRNEKFKNSREACSMIIEGAYLADMHIDFFNSKNGQEAKSVDYHVYNACSGDLYDVFLRIVECSDGTVTVRLHRPPMKEKLSEHPQFSDEDKVDHRTVALLATCDKKWLLSINLKHHMLTLPIGKVHPNESLWQGLCREMWEELGFKLEHIFRGCQTGTTTLKTKFKKTYDFDGTPVNIETFVFHIDSDECYSSGIWLQAENREPEKCGGLMWVNRDDIRRIAESTGLMLADCLDAALNADMVRVDHIVQ